jgi:hypothetical protein
MRTISAVTASAATVPTQTTLLCSAHVAQGTAFHLLRPIYAAFLSISLDFLSSPFCYFSFR